MRRSFPHTHHETVETDPDKARIYHHPKELGCTTYIPPLNGFNCLAQPASVECGASTPSHVAVNPANAPELQALAYG